MIKNTQMCHTYRCHGNRQVRSKQPLKCIFVDTKNGDASHGSSVGKLTSPQSPTMYLTLHILRFRYPFRHLAPPVFHEGHVLENNMKSNLFRHPSFLRERLRTLLATMTTFPYYFIALSFTLCITSCPSTKKSST
jgi:hypothetical protein